MIFVKIVDDNTDDFRVFVKFKADWITLSPNKISFSKQLYIFLVLPPLRNDIGDVGGAHEIRLGIWHHGRVATHGDYQKKHFRKDFPAIQFL